MKRTKRTKKNIRQKKQLPEKRQNKRPSGYIKIILPILVSILSFGIMLAFAPKKYITEEYSLPREVFFILNFLFSAFIFYVVFSQSKKKTKQLSKYMFLLLLTANIITSTIVKFSPDTENTKLLITFLISDFLIIPGGILGVVSVILHKESISELFQKNNQQFL